MPPSELERSSVVMVGGGCWCFVVGGWCFVVRGAPSSSSGQKEDERDVKVVGDAEIMIT